MALVPRPFQISLIVLPLPPLAPCAKDNKPSGLLIQDVLQNYLPSSPWLAVSDPISNSFGSHLITSLFSVSLLTSAAPIASPDAVVVREPEPVPVAEPEIDPRICSFSCDKK